MQSISKSKAQDKQNPHFVNKINFIFLFLYYKSKFRFVFFFIKKRKDYGRHIYVKSERKKKMATGVSMIQKLSTTHNFIIN